MNGANEDSEKKDALWQLLGKAKQPEVSPFFSRNVLRAVRVEQPAKSRVWARWSWRAATACVIAAAAFGVATAPHRDAAKNDAAVTQQIAANPDYEVIQHLDELAANEENSLWLDDSKN